MRDYGGPAKRRAAKRPAHPRSLPKARTPGISAHPADRPANRTKDANRAAAYKRSRAYRGQIRQTYKEQPIPQRKVILKQAAQRKSTEGGEAARVHNSRAMQDDLDLARFGFLPRKYYGQGKAGRVEAELGLKADAAAVKAFDKKHGGRTLKRLPFPRVETLDKIDDPKIRKLLDAKTIDLEVGFNPADYAKKSSGIAHIIDKLGGGTKSSALFALRQLARPGAGIASANEAATRDNVPGATTIGLDKLDDWVKGFGEGFSKPQKHMRDYNKILERQGVKNPWIQEPLAFGMAVSTDPLTFITAGGGSIAKSAAMKGYEQAIARGESEAAAVKVARKIWEDAPSHQKAGGIKAGVRGTPAIVLSRGRSTHLQTKPIGGRPIAGVRAAARKAGITNIRPLGASTGAIRNAANAVAPTVRPSGWSTVDWEIARRAARKTRAGEREAQRHASYRLRAYTEATKGWTPAEHLAVKQAAESRDLSKLPDKLKPVAEQVAKDLEIAQHQRVGMGLSKALAPGSRVGVGEAPKRPNFAVPFGRLDVATSRAAVTSAIAGYRAALKKAGFETGRASQRSAYDLKQLRTRGMDEAADSIELARARVKDATKAHAEVKAEAAKQRKAMDEYNKAMGKWMRAPAGFFPRQLAPGVLLDNATQMARGGERIVDQSRKHTEALEFMDPEDVAKYEGRIPVAMAQYLLKHGRKTNLSNLNERIASLGHSLRVLPDDVDTLAGQPLELYSKEPTGLHPLFDKTGAVDKDALAQAVRQGHPITQVDRKLADAVRLMARGQKGYEDKMAAAGISLEAHGLDDAERRGPGAFYDTQQRRLKILQTSINPAYHIVNAIGDSFNAVIGGARPGDFKAAFRLRKVESALKNADRALNPMTPTGRLHQANPLSRATAKILADARQHVEDFGPNGKLSDLDVVSLGVSHGALRTGLTSGELRAASRGAAIETEQSVPARAMEGLQNVSDWREDLVRLTTFRGALKRGLSPDEAAEWASKHHFDYADLSPVEQKFFRRLVPFWTFMARNTPLQVRSLAARPGVYTTEEHARATSASSAGLKSDFANNLREFEQAGVPWGTPLKMALKDTKLGKITAPITLYPKLPLMDLNNIPYPMYSTEGELAEGATLREAGMNMLNRVSPFAKIPLEQILGISTFTGSKQKDLVQAPSWMPKEFTVPFRDPRTNKMVRGISWRVLELMQSVPVTNTLSRQGTSTLHGQPSADDLRWAGWLAGPRPSLQDPRVVKINQLFEQREKLTHEINLLKPQVAHHERGDEWTGKVRKKMDMVKKINNRIYELSARTGAANPAGVPPAKPRHKKHPIGGFGSGGFDAGSGAGLGGGFR